MTIPKPTRGVSNSNPACDCGHSAHQYMHGQGNIGPCVTKKCPCQRPSSLPPLAPSVCSCGLRYATRKTLELHQRITGHGASTLPPEALDLL